MKRFFSFFMIGVICLTACGSKGEAELSADSEVKTESSADSKAEPELPVYYSGSNTMDRRMPESYSDLMNYSDAVVIAEPVAEKEQLIEKEYNGEGAGNRRTHGGFLQGRSGHSG